MHDLTPQQISTPALAPLSTKQRAFVEHYLQCWNATEAARNAGYSRRTARAIGSENLTKPAIQQAIAARVSELTMSANEVLVRLSAIARGSMADFLCIDVDTVRVDLVAAANAGTLGLIKKCSIDKDSRVSIELYSAYDALVQLGKAHRLFVERQEWSGPNGGPIRIAAEDLAEARRKAAQFEQETFGNDT